MPTNSNNNIEHIYSIIVPFYSTSSIHMIYFRRQGRKRTPPEVAKSTFAVDLTRKEAKAPEDAIHIIANQNPQDGENVWEI